MNDLVVKNDVADKRSTATVYINSRMVEKQGLNEEEVNQVMALHMERLVLLGAMKVLTKKDVDQLRELAGKISNLDYQLQDAWKFTRDLNYHKFWEVPHCTCPKLDNEDRWGTGIPIFVENCVIHADAEGEEF